MIYIENITSAQTIYIPRQDELSYHHGSGDYNEGYSDGWSDGVSHQKGLLSTTAFTENGEYTSQNGWSGVSVDVPHTGHTDQELQDAYDSGYTSGETHQKSLLSTTAITNNGEYSNENGWSEISVNVPTAQTPSIGNGNFTSNGKYYSSDENLDGYSAVTVNVDNAKVAGVQNVSVSANGTTIINPPTYGVNVVETNKKVTITAYGYYEKTYIGYIEDEFNPQYGYIDIYWQYGGIDYDDEEWTGERIYVSFTGNTIMEIEFDDYHAGLDFIGDGDTGGTYDGSSIINLDVNVPTTGYTQQDLDNAYGSGYASGASDGFSDGYSSGNTDGRQAIISTFTSATITQNGVFGSSATPFTSVTVNTSGSTSVLGNGSFSANGTYSAATESLDGYSTVVVDVPQDYTSQDIENAYDSGYTDGVNSIQFSSTAITENGMYEGSFSSFTVNVPTSGSASVGEATFSENGTYSAATYGLDGFSVVTVDSQNGMGEFYCIYGENAVFNIGNAMGSRTEFESLTSSMLPLSNLTITIKGGSTDYPYDCDEKVKFYWSGNTSSYKFYGSAYKNGSWSSSTLSYSHPTNSLPSLHTVGLTTKKASVDYDSVTFNGYRVLNTCGVIISGSSYYLKGVNLNHGFCNVVATVDSNGVACLYFNGRYFYPTSGNAYPVYRKYVNGNYIYYMAKTIPTV